jgi:hypothetical protein
MQDRGSRIEGPLDWTCSCGAHNRAPAMPVGPATFTCKRCGLVLEVRILDPREAQDFFDGVDPAGEGERIEGSACSD